MSSRRTQLRKVSAQQGIQSVEIGAQLLGVLAEAAGPLTLRDLAAAAGMSSSKAHRYLVSFARSGLVQQDAGTSRYDLGPMSLKLGLAALSRRNAVRFATEALIELNQKLDKTVLLSVWGLHGPTVVGMYDSSQILICNLNVGSVIPLLSSASGRVFLAFLPRSTTQRMVERELKGALTQIAASRVRTMKDVDAIVAEIRKTRIGTTREELVPGMSAAAAPIFDHEGRIVASIATFGISGGDELAAPGSPVSLLVRAAAGVSTRLGCERSGPGSSFVEWLERRKAGAGGRPDTFVQEPPPALVSGRAHA